MVELVEEAVESSTQLRPLVGQLWFQHPACRPAAHLLEMVRLTVRLEDVKALGIQALNYVIHGTVVVLDRSAHGRRQSADSCYWNLSVRFILSACSL